MHFPKKISRYELLYVKMQELFIAEHQVTLLNTFVKRIFSLQKLHRNYTTIYLSFILIVSKTGMKRRRRNNKYWHFKSIYLFIFFPFYVFFFFQKTGWQLHSTRWWKSTYSLVVFATFCYIGPILNWRNNFFIYKSL